MSKSRALRFASLDVMPPRLRELVHAATEGKQVQKGFMPGVATAARVATEILAEKKAKPRKYHNTPTVVDGIRFDSKREARFYEQLKARKGMGEVEYWLHQVPIRLPGGTRYVVDFLVFYTDPCRGPDYVDVKGKETQAFKIKKREVEHHYPIQIVVV